MTAVDACLDGAGWRHRLATLLELPMVQHALIGLILINAVILRMETSSALMAIGCVITAQKLIFEQRKVS